MVGEGMNEQPQKLSGFPCRRSASLPSGMWTAGLSLSWTPLRLPTGKMLGISLPASTTT